MRFLPLVEMTKRRLLDFLDNFFRKNAHFSFLRRRIRNQFLYFIDFS